MNALRNIFSTRTLNLLRQNGQNALLNLTQQQPVEDAATSAPIIGNDNNTKPAPLLIPKSILDATTFTGKKFAANGASSGSVSPTTLKNYRRMQRKVELVYRCKLCNTRNSKTVTEAAYTSGIVILQCDGCGVNHLICDNVGWFADTKSKGKSFDEMLAEQGNRVKVIKVNERGELI
ncbi:uncharacterized protein LOC119666693 [Teleopsis dalmanni]|uniref:uncharacterized protein LOC119666693 n=1 Tax=Teleopsis dalmanni TaxID=139649 RepID=UPI0018CE862F|nr:uncharacterized protein LOC119666693 [Teleopsis dalmanni]